MANDNARRAKEELHTGRNSANSCKATADEAYGVIRGDLRGAYKTKQVNNIKELT
jgi:hypothetical protein